MAAMIEVEVWVLIDESGDYAVAKTGEDLPAAYENDIQPVADAGATRRVRVVLSVPTPETVTLAGTVPAEGEAALNVA